MPRTKARSEAWRFARLSSKGRSPLQPNFIPGTKIVEQHGAGDDVRSVKVGDNGVVGAEGVPKRSLGTRGTSRERGKASIVQAGMGC